MIDSTESNPVALPCRVYEDFFPAFVSVEGASKRIAQTTA